MSTLEVLAKAAAKTPRYAEAVSGYGDLTWQDVLQALQGVSLAKTSFALFLIAGDKTCRHYFGAGLFMDAMQQLPVRNWSNSRRHEGYHGAVKALCQLAVMEWGDPSQYTHSRRAKIMGVSRATWDRKYRSVYSGIHSIPESWRREIEQLLRQRLR